MKKPKKATTRPAQKPRGNKPQDASRDELHPEYDAALIRMGVRGKYAAAYAQSTNVVVLDPDVAKEFPNAVAVNDALRGLARIIEHHRPSRPPTGSSRRTA